MMVLKILITNGKKNLLTTISNAIQFENDKILQSEIFL